jgi:ribose transport system permease protein
MSSPTKSDVAAPRKEARAAREHRPQRSVLALAEAYALLVLTVLVAILFSVLPKSSVSFPTWANFQIIVGDQSILLVISLAVLIPMVANVWDFSPAANAGMSAIVAAVIVSHNHGLPLAVGGAILAGTVIGLLNGVLITVAKINSVIATFGMTIVIAGLVQLMTDGSSIVEGIPQGLPAFGSDRFLAVPKLAWLSLLVALIVYYVLRYTPFGRHLYAIGSNREAAHLVGIRVELSTCLTFAISGALGGVAGVMILARTGAGNPSVGPDYILAAYAAVFLGSIAVHPGRWNVWGVFIAIIFLGVLNSGLTLAGVSPWITLLVNGGALLVGVGVANLLARQRGQVRSTS